MVESNNTRGYGVAIEGEHQDECFYEGEHIDCLDTINKWCNAEVREVEGDRIFVHYTGFVAKYDEWLYTKANEN